MTRFRKVPRPELDPRYDIHDRDSSHEVWDMGVDLELFSGPIYIKPQYILEIARLEGYVPGEKYEQLLAENEILRKNRKIGEALEEIPTKLGELRNEFLDYLAAYRSNPLDSDSVTDDSSDNRDSENIEVEGDIDFDFGEGVGFDGSDVEDSGSSNGTVKNAS